ncbi:MAG: FAD-dependent thymidylate synthase [Treponema sp.]|jgi:thymidylate synthase (FAD)|nr:FAD-dependent thymidylate synthase [Treponema sp.]
MAHCRIPEAEAILDQQFVVLDKGFVQLVDYLGGDERVVQAAHISYRSDNAATIRSHEALIDFLIENEHWTPFEQVVFTFRIKLPIFIARQWVRHRTARINEVSGRYSTLQEEFYVPDFEDQQLRESFAHEQESAYKKYRERINAKIPREIARINLPLSLYTEWYWQIDLRNLFNFLKLRLDKSAQKEISQYAQVILNISHTVAPLSCHAFQKKVL